ncbi:MAG: hypothetical protein ACI84R_003569 [Candidatus Azotimanducaceae bacterium]|jgi:hypothetical protein
MRPRCAACTIWGVRYQKVTLSKEFHTCEAAHLHHAGFRGRFDDEL